jgi:hypothetical protein
VLRGVGVVRTVVEAVREVQVGAGLRGSATRGLPRVAGS